MQIWVIWVTYPMELRGKEAALCAYAKGDICSLSIVASELNCKQKLQIQLLLEYLSIHDPLPLELTKPRLFPYISYLDGSLSYVSKLSHMWLSYIWESSNTLWALFFLLNCLRTMRIKPILHNQVPSCLLCLWFLSHF